MTRKHFIALAERISRLDEPSRSHAAHAVADVCVKFSDGFDRDRFYRACALHVEEEIAQAMGLRT
jgi:hypothetical protein